MFHKLTSITKYASMTLEQSGDNDVSAKLLKLAGMDIEPKINPENMVYLTPEAGTDYLNF